MRNANVPGLLDSILAETIPMHGRMIHGQKNGELFEESQAYDIHGRVCVYLSLLFWNFD
jgi:kynurenine 3-monooxygenase